MVCYMMLWSANHPIIRVIRTPTVPYNTPLVWYVATLYFLQYIIVYYVSQKQAKTLEGSGK